MDETQLLMELRRHLLRAEHDRSTLRQSLIGMVKCIGRHGIPEADAPSNLSSFRRKHGKDDKTNEARSA